MISIIICSRTAEVSPELKANIDDTIGVEYELIVIDNSDGGYNIFEAYNIGIKQSKYPFVCFMHDDIKYHTQNWGTLVSSHFSEEKTGAIGVAGTPYVPYMPGAWWGGKLVNINISSKNTENQQSAICKYPPTLAIKNKVVVLDGVWFCIRKTLFESISFDELTYTGFHFYDVDISMQASQAGYNIYCVFDIALQHFSNGDVNKTWQENALAFNKKWKYKLPAVCIPLNYRDRCEAELQTLHEFGRIMIANGMPPKKAYRNIFFRLLKYPKIHFYAKSLLHLMRHLLKSL